MSATVTAKPLRVDSWWSTALRQPRRLWLRRAVFQVHLWSGLLVGLLSTVAGLSGSAIVYRESLDRRLAPALYRTTPGPALPADTLLAAARLHLPAGSTLRDLDIPGHAGSPWLFRIVDRGGRRTTAFLDPATGRILGLRGEREGLMNWLDSLHTELLAGQTGTCVNGIGAAALFLLCATGIVLWWPGRGRIRRALRIHLPRPRQRNASQTRTQASTQVTARAAYRVTTQTPARVPIQTTGSPRPGSPQAPLQPRVSFRWRRFNWDLHTAGGFWIVLPLAAEAFTGIFLCFGLTGLIVLLGGRASEFAEILATPKLTHTCPAFQHLRASALTLNGAVPQPLQRSLDRARELHPAAAADTFVLLPQDSTTALTLYQRSEADLRLGSLRVTAIDPCTGAVLKDVSSRQSSLPLRLVLFLDAFHFGLIGGTLTQAAWVLLGLTPGTLFLTGLLLWCRRIVIPRMDRRATANPLRAITAA